jgi:SAM-dependent methyltransferase
MVLEKQDKDRLLCFYDRSLRLHGPDSPLSLHWTSPEDQLVRFSILSRVGDLSGRSVLDVGCGVGDLYGFLSRRFSGFSYLGIDIVPEMVKQAKLKYPRARFEVADTCSLNAKFDYVFASGSLTFNVRGGKRFYFGVLRHMFSLCRRAAAFNMLDESVYKADRNFLSYDIREVERECKKLTRKYQIVTGYDQGDFTVFLYKR